MYILLDLLNPNLYVEFSTVEGSYSDVYCHTLPLRVIYIRVGVVFCPLVCRCGATVLQDALPFMARLVHVCNME